MDPLILSALAALGAHAIALAALLARLRWRERQLRADRASLARLARALPPGFRLDEVRADGSELHLATSPEPI